MKEKDIFLEEKQEVEELLKTKLLSPDIAKFSATPGGFITLTLSGEEQGMVNIIRAFPFTAENEFLSVRTADDKQRELGMIEKLSVFDRFTTFVGGHINKEGNIAGPKGLEHMVDCVRYFEGERSTSFRILRAGKNRFGSTNEIGVFEMVDTGLKELQNPSEILLSGRPDNAPGTCVTCVIEGSRPILAEIQALVAPATYNAGRRSTNGIDYNRATLLLAVLEKRGGMAVSGCDAYINVIGGLELDEPAADLATTLAIASSFRDLPLGRDMAAVGEVGLSGEIRSVNSLNMRLSEIARLGFKRCVIPAHIKDDIKKPDGLEIISVKDIREAIKATLG